MTTHIDMTHMLNDRTIKSAERQAGFRKRMLDAGMVQVSGWVHRRQASDVVQLMRRLRGGGHLAVGPVRNEYNGQLEKLEK